MDTFTPPLPPSLEPQGTRRARLLTVPFGDNYGAVSPNGLNPLDEIWSLEWPPLTEANAAIIDQFFKDHIAKSFFWLAPRDTVLKKWLCKEWQRVPLRGPSLSGLDRITATLERVYWFAI